MTMSPSEYSVIFVDDDPNAVLLFKRAYQTANLKNPLQLFGDGQEVIDYLRQLLAKDGNQTSDAPPALLLLDIKMPRRTGLEVLEWVRAQPGLKRLVTVMMSNSDFPSDINRAYDLGCNSYMQKPMGFNELVERVKLVNSYWLLVNKQPDVRHPPNSSGP